MGQDATECGWATGALGAFAEAWLAARPPNSTAAAGVGTSIGQLVAGTPSAIGALAGTHDIDALGSTLPYCDIVVTVKALASHALRTGLVERLQTVVLSRVPNLVPFLG